MATYEFFKTKALPFVLKWEGGYVNNPNDKGGATNYGITQYTYNSWLSGLRAEAETVREGEPCNAVKREQPSSLGLASKDVRNITMSEVEQIYFKNYWLKAGCDKMSDKFALLAFDTAVNMGLARVNQFLRAAQWKYPDKFIDAREAKYREFALYGNQKIFLQGWLNRLNDLKKVVDSM